MPVIDRAICALSGHPFRTLARPLMHRRSTIFLLHRERNEAAGIAGHAIDEVRDAITTLRRCGARFLSLRELVEHGLQHGDFPSDAVALTIDDGFADQARLARACLEAGAPVTVFLITGFLDGRLWPWDDRVSYAVRHSPLERASLSISGCEWQGSMTTADERRQASRALRNLLKACPQRDHESTLQQVFEQLAVRMPARPPGPFTPLTWDEARQLEREGVEFGPHSVTHRIFSQLDDAAVRQEILESCQRLRAELKRPLPIFAWPTGRSTDFTERDCRLATDYGLRAAVATGDDYATLQPGSDVGNYRLQRFALPHSIREVMKYGSWIERAKQVLRLHGTSPAS